MIRQTANVLIQNNYIAQKLSVEQFTNILLHFRPEHGPEIPEIPEILKSVLKCPEIH